MALISSKKSGTLSFFYHFFTIFAYFSQNCHFFPFWPFCASPWITPHHQWPQFVVSCSQGPISLWMTLPMNIIDELKKWQKWPFFPFLAILMSADSPKWPSPYKGGLWGTLLWTLGSSLDPTTTQKKTPVESEAQLLFWDTSRGHPWKSLNGQK